MSTVSDTAGGGGPWGVLALGGVLLVAAAAVVVLRRRRSMGVAAILLAVAVLTSAGGLLGCAVDGVDESAGSGDDVETAGGEPAPPTSAPGSTVPTAEEA